MEYLVGDFKPTDVPNDDIFQAVTDGLFQGDWPTDIGKREFIVAFAAAAKMINDKTKKDKAKVEKDEARNIAVIKAKKAKAEAKKAAAAKAKKHKAKAKKAAAARAELEGWILLSDSTWAGYSAGYDVMEGYLMMPEEVFSQMPISPTHIFLQAGVGGLAAAVTASVRSNWGTSSKIIVVEPSEAPAIMESIKVGKPVYAEGEASIMGRLDCKEPSHLALYCLAKEADFFMTLTDSEVLESIDGLNKYGLSTSASGGAGYAGLVKALMNQSCNLDSNSHVLLFLSEGATDD